MIKNILFFLLPLFLLNAHAAPVSVEVSTNDPVVNQKFVMMVTVTIEGDDEPEITFTPSGLSVSEKIPQGVTTRTTYINGQLEVKKEVSIAYELTPTRLGRVSIAQIKILADGKQYTHPSINLSVLSEPRELPDFFALAIAEKTELYKGEGTVLRYYLYKKVEALNVDIKEFPKLKNVMKRYLQENSGLERINYENELFERQLLYSATIFPEKSGEIVMDPIKIVVTYPDRPGSAFGFPRSTRMLTKSLSSKPLSLFVKDIPLDQLPQGFTGLVGKHSFKLDLNKNKFLINEPLELKLTISGDGNLEGLEAPDLIKSELFESFENNSDLQIIDPSKATKTITYTYLARKSGEVQEQKIPLSYFDPELQKFQSIDLNLPSLIISGEQVASSVNNQVIESSSSSNVLNDNQIQKMPSAIRLLAPDWSSTSSFSINWLKYLNYLLFFVVFCLILKIILPDFKKQDHPIDVAIKNVRATNYSYSSIYELLSYLPLNDEDKSIINRISKSSLAEDTKKYFTDLYTNSEKIFSNEEDKKLNFKFNKKMFNELSRELKKNM